MHNIFIFTFFEYCHKGVKKKMLFTYILLMQQCFFFSNRHPQIRNKLEQHMSCSLTEYKEFIDNEMLLILGQMDKPTLIFDHVYLVSFFIFLIFLFMFFLFYPLNFIYIIFSLLTFHHAVAHFKLWIILSSVNSFLLFILQLFKRSLCLFPFCRAPSGTLPTWKNYAAAGKLKS